MKIESFSLIFFVDNEYGENCELLFIFFFFSDNEDSEGRELFFSRTSFDGEAWRHQSTYHCIEAYCFVVEFIVLGC